MKNKLLNRFLIMLLSAVMVINTLPLQVFAEEMTDLSNNEGQQSEVIDEPVVTETPAPTEVVDTPVFYNIEPTSNDTGTTYATTGSKTHTDYLFIATDRHTDTSIIASMINAMEANIGENELDYLALGGDMVGSGNSHPAYKSSEVLGEVTGATSSLDASNVDIVAGIHDMNVNDDAGIVLPYTSGGAQIYEGTRFYVYGVPESCISGAVSGVDPETEANDFVTWANGADIDKSKAIIVVSHYPLHQRRNDNDGAVYWAAALNTVAAGDDTAIDRNVAFFWGHNHTGESSADTAVYHVAPNGSISVQGGLSSQKIYFTYANAGYLNANSSATLVKITDDTITFDKYVNSNVTSNSVPRVVTETKTLTGISVDGTKEYTVGGNDLDLTVTATYDDGTTADVTADAQFEPDELTASGEYTITASYGDMTDTIDVTVKLYDEVLNDYGDLLISVEALSQGATALEVVWDDDAAAVLDTKELYTDYVVYDLALTNPGETTEYAMSLSDNMDSSNLAVYHVAEDGTLTLVAHEIENDCVVFTTSLTGTFAYGSITVPEGYTISSVTLANIPTDLFVGGSLDLLKAEITAIYTKDGAEDYVRKLTVYDYNEKNFSGYDVNVIGAQTATFTFEGVSAELDIYVWGDEFTVNNVTVNVGEGEYGVTEAVITESKNSNVATAIKNVITGDNYVAYDITLNYADGYAANDATKTVTLPVPEGVTNPVVYYVSDSGKSVVDMKAVDNGNGTVTFETNHFSTYVLGDGTTIETESQNAVTQGSSSSITAYVLTNTLTANSEYLIVNINETGSGYALLNDSGSTGSVAVTVKESNGNKYIELSNASAVWKAITNSSGFNLTNTLNNTTYYLEASGSTSKISIDEKDDNTSRYWQYKNDDLGYYGGNSTHYIYYNNGFVSAKNSGSEEVYIYQKQTIDAGVIGHTYSVEGKDMEVAAIKDTTIDLSSILYDTPDNGTKTDITASSGLTPTYEIVTSKGNSAVISNINGSTATLSGTIGTAVVKVTYTSGDLVAWDEFIVTTSTPDHYDIELHKALMTEATDVTADNVTNFYTYNSTTGFYEKATSYVAGTTYYTVPVVAGEEITAPVALKGIEAGDTYSVWAIVKAYVNEDDSEGTDIGKLGDALTWTVSDESIAEINEDTGVITFTGNSYGTFTVTVSYEGADGKIITDTITISVTESLYVVPGDGTNDFPEYPNEGAIRFDKNATAVGNYSETGIAKVELSMTGVPYSKGSEIDVVIMLDMTGSMSDTAMTAAEESAIAFAEKIVKNEDGTYNDNRICVMAFNSSSSSPFTYWELGTITADQWTDFCTAVRGASDNQTGGGTPYDEALAKCQTVLSDAKADGIGNDRDQFCVFVSDGGPTSYKYITNYDAVKAGTSSSYTSSSASASGGANQSDSNFATIATYTHEYYSTLMKDDGVVMYSVLTGLVAANYPNCTTILKNIASDDKKAFVVEDGSDTSELTTTLSGIANEIVEAATDVVVEDKIGSNYTMNFSIPGFDTDNAVSSDALDGTTEFYIQVVEYKLNADKERTGDPTILENFTFNSDGSLKSHTVDGTECTDCSHITTDGNDVIAKISGTYFTYENKGDAGEYLTWTAEKITTTELALQYFAYLDNSTGLADDVVATQAGTYYTNEYATLTYKNHLKHEVQQEFPIPQMTWNGAQVSYVFYLVNESGQPVNRAGRVVPFAEAVYITDVHTESIIWNQLEQSAGLEASKLANELVPDVYALYDDDASYMIHVYEDEQQDNLNNHFVIGGDVTDDYSVTNEWTNANTTYVFNSKSDSNKYTEYGTYIANDGNASIDTTTYLCKGNGVVTATIEKVTVTKEQFPNSAYYYLNENGKYVLAANFDSNATYYQISSASYTKVEGETHVLASELEMPEGATRPTGSTVLDGHAYYIDENNKVYTIVKKSNGTEVHKGFDFHNTTVAFAVVWEPELTADTIVIDYGLDVVVDVYTNDGLAAGVKNVMLNPVTDVEMNKGSYDDPVGSTSVTSTDGLWTASVENLTSVRFSMNEIGINAPAVFYYEAGVNYYTTENSVQTLNSKHMYSSVTVIPAATIYYEDEYVDLYTYERTSVDGAWGNPIEGWDTNSKHASALQDVDRPGAKKEVMSSLYDADNVYGYDSAYENCSTYSLDNAAIVSVNSLKKATAKFSFYGTGFDVISLTSNKTGLMTVAIYKHGETTKYKGFFVDTYYGYEQNADGEWVVSVNKPNALYQVPVMEVADLPYDHYDVEITVAYNSFFDNSQYTQTDSETGEVTSLGKYDFYLDAIRIYDPVNDGVNDSTSVTVNAYKADGEAWPMYHELRDMLITAKTFDSVGNDGIEGVVFIDSLDNVDSTKVVTDYKNYGPNNEVYLASGQSLSFVLNNASDAKAVHLGLKSVGGSTSYKIYDAEKSNITSAASNEINTATDLYHDITSLIGKNIVITNTGSNILSITNLKATYESNPTSTSSVMFMVRRSSVNSALVSLEPVVDEEVETPNTGTITPEVGNNNSDTEETTPSTGATGPEAPVGGPANEGNTSTDTTVESEGTDSETVVTPDHGSTEDEETVTPDISVDETPEIEVEEQLGFFASLIKIIVDFFVSMFSWLIGLVA